LFGAALAIASTGCRQEPVDLPEIFITRSVGVNFLERGQLPEAETQFKRLIQLAPKDPLGYANLGLTYLRAGRYSDAERELRRAQKLDPTSPDVELIVARLYSLTGRWDEARATLEKLHSNRPTDAKVLYALAEIESRDSSQAANAGYERRLRQVLAVVPANIAVQLKIISVFMRRGESDSALHHLEELRRLRPEPPKEALPLLATSIELLRTGKLTDARAPFKMFLHLMELSQPYQAALADVKWLEGPIVGRPVLTFTPQSLLQMQGVIPGRTADRMHFTDVTLDAGFAESRSTGERRVPSLAPESGMALATGDFDGDGTDDLLVSFQSRDQQGAVTRLYRVLAGEVVDVTQRWAFPMTGSAAAAAVGDFDNDGWLDLFVIGSDERGHLLRNTGNGKFEDITAKSRITEVRGARKALFVDLDHDGDLDLLLVGGARNRLYRNNADGTFTEVAESMGLAGTGGGRDVGLADFDGDGRIDLIIATDHGPTLYRNTGARHFEDITATSGLAADGGVEAVDVSDYNNDGLLDLVLAPVDGGPPTLWRSAGNGAFTRDKRSDDVLRQMVSLADVAVRLVDVDNDGWLDLFVVGTPSGSSRGRGAFLFHNDRSGKYEGRSRVLPATLRSGGAIAPSDIDGDGDLDLFVADPAGVRVLRNDGGNANLSAQVALIGLRTGSSKNNDFGIGAKLELRAGEIFQTRIVTERVTHFGLGPHLKADVLRVEWPNGVPETIYFPGTDQQVLELEMLKGSCAFLYTWDGKGFRFITDVMWRSALGMPMGMMAGGEGAGARTAYAPAGASQEYLRIPGSALQPRDGRYVLQLTEELWETAYTDQIKLLAVDHPDSVDIFVDERFVPPGPLQLRLFNVVRPHPPLSATDEDGNDVLPALREHDQAYVSNLTPLAYQGLVEPHDLILDLGDDAGRPRTSLFLRGWIYPTDASINVALSQQSKIKTMLPSLEVRNAAGRWTMAIPNIGFPSGKDKTVVVDLAGKFPTKDHHVRIRTNMQIYWDQAFLSGDAAGSPVKVTTLAPVAADLHFRGFSRMYRKGGRYGPYWFAYDEVSKESPWRPIEGAFTRFGDVLPLLRNPDDMYVIMGLGDEATVQFDATSASTLPAGWKRDFLLYTDGWIKDSDLNTAFGNTVGPLPFHRMKEYPYAPGDSYPTDAEHQRYLRAYNTRISQRR